jgi:ABC-type phosphate transport system substrate-binding protein
VAAAGLLLTGGAASQEAPADFQVIVNSNNPVKKLKASTVSDMFLKKVTTWPQGGTVQPVDLPATNHTRISFSEAIHGRSVASIKSYWQQLIFSGRDVPPPEKADEDEVIEFVAANPNAIGYISTSYGIGGPVKQIKITD